MEETAGQKYNVRMCYGGGRNNDDNVYGAVIMTKAIMTVRPVQLMNAD